MSARNPGGDQSGAADSPILAHLASEDLEILAQIFAAAYLRVACRGKAQPKQSNSWNGLDDLGHSEPSCVGATGAQETTP